MLREDLRHRLRVQDIGMQRIVRLVRLGHVHESAECLRAQVPVHEPFHVPHRFQRALRNFGYQSFQVGRAKRAEAV